MTTIETSSADDDSPVTLRWTNTEHGDVYEVQMWLGHDGVPVVQIDTGDAIGRVRVNLNDGVIWDGDPATDSAPGEYGRQWLEKNA